MTRRAVLGGGMAVLAAPMLARAATARRFELSRGGSDIGFHTLTAQTSGADLIMDIAIEIRVKVLGLTAYLYEHRNRETWRDGRLVAIEAKTNADGEDDFCRVSRSGDGYEVEGSAFQGRLTGALAPTSYWNHNNFRIDRWISTQSGKPLPVTFETRQAGGDEIWSVAGPDNFATELTYDAAMEWRSCRFDARGTDIVYRETAPGPRLLALL